MTGPEPAAHALPPGAPLITQADCWRRQRETLRVLADILDAHPDLPAITWTVSWLGGVNGDVLGLGMPPEQVRATFTAWRQALRLGSVQESPIRDTGIVSMVGRTYRGIVRVSLTARAYYPLPDDTEPVAGPTRDGASHRPRGRTAARRDRASHPGHPRRHAPSTSSEAGVVTPEQRRLRAQIAANVRWSKYMARKDQAYLARKAFFVRLERQVDPEGKLPPDERAALILSAAREVSARLNAANARKREHPRQQDKDECWRLT
jgi:hypothetical protein